MALCSLFHSLRLVHFVIFVVYAWFVWRLHRLYHERWDQKVGVSFIHHYFLYVF